jgi:hypothetical protein
VVPHLGSTNVISSYPLKAKYVELMGKEKGTTQVMYIVMLKDGPKRVKKIFSTILEGVFEMVRWRWRKWNHIKKKILKLKCFSPRRILTSPLFEESFGAFLFLFLFLTLLLFLFFQCVFSLFLFFSMLHLLGILMIFEEKNHFLKNFFSNEMVWS